MAHSAIMSVRITGNADDAVKAFEKTTTKAAAFGSAIGGLAVKGVTALWDTVKGFAGDVVNMSDSTDKFMNTMSFAGIDTKAVQAATKETRKYADATVYGLDDIQNTTAQLAANGIGNYMELTEAAGNLNAVAGGNADSFKSVAMVLTQTAGAGKLTTENWNQLADAIPGASGKLQEALLKNGAYTGNFRDAMSKGEITADEFNKALMDLGMTDVAKQAATSTSTIEGAMGNLEAAVTGGLTDAFNFFKPAVTGGINGRHKPRADRHAGIADVLHTGQGHRSVQRIADGRAVGRRRTAIIVDRHHGRRERDDRRTAGRNLVRQRAQRRRHGRRRRGGRHCRHHRHADCRRRSGTAQRGHGREPDHAGHHAHRRARGRTHLLLHLHQHRQGRLVELHKFPVRLRAGHHRLLLRSRLHHRQHLQLGRERCQERVERRRLMVPWHPGHNRRLLLRSRHTALQRRREHHQRIPQRPQIDVEQRDRLAHKGPISYDRRLLIPAGQAIMTGFAQGLNTGFDSHVETAISRANRRLAAMPLNLSAQGNTATPAVVNTWNVEINGEVIDKDGTAKAIKRLLADYDARRS